MHEKVNVYIVSEDKLSDQKIEIEYNNGTKMVCPVIKSASRADAIKHCEFLTIVALRGNDAFENLNTFVNDFSRHRNYEIENYMDEISKIRGHKIDEICPFNGFKWFD